MNELDDDIYQQLMKSDSLELELYIEDFMKNYKFDDSGEIFKGNNKFLNQRTITTLYRSAVANGQVEQLCAVLSKLDETFFQRYC